MRITETRPFCIASSAAACTEVFVHTIGKPDRSNAHVEERLGEQRFGAAIERLRMQDRIARTDEGEQGRGDRRHAGGKQRTAFRTLVDGQPVLDDLAVGVIETRIDQPAPVPAGGSRRPETKSKKSRPSSADLNTKVEVRNTGGLTAPSDNSGSYP